MGEGKSVHEVKSCGVIILAAGKSTRLGQPKQLLAYGTKMLLQHAINSAIRLDPQPLILVLGSDKELIEKQLDTSGVTMVENRNFETGIASSIVSGVEALLAVSSNTDGLILMVCDQPFAGSEILQGLLDRQKKTGSAIVACSYAGTYGTPAFFHRSLFPDLLSLSGDSGAKKLISKYKDRASFVEFERGGIDIDTPEDYKKLSK